MTLTMTVDEVKKNLGATVQPGTYKLEEILLMNDRPMQLVKGKRRNHK
jgi:hypothetical protein